MSLSNEAQIVILGAVLSLFSGLAGYLFRGWLDRREYDRRRKLEYSDRIREQLTRPAQRPLKFWRQEVYTDDDGTIKPPPPPLQRRPRPLPSLRKPHHLAERYKNRAMHRSSLHRGEMPEK